MQSYQTLLIQLCQLISYFKRRKGEYTGCSSVLQVPWSSSKRTLCCASFLLQAHMKFFYFSFSLRFGLKVSVLKNQAPEEEVESLSTWEAKLCLSEIPFAKAYSHALLQINGLKTNLKSCSHWTHLQNSCWFRWEQGSQDATFFFVFSTRSSY